MSLKIGYPNIFISDDNLVKKFLRGILDQFLAGFQMILNRLYYFMEINDARIAQIKGYTLCTVWLMRIGST